MTDVIFAFDTEDFTSPRAADGILLEAELLRSEGVRGAFDLVGLLAKNLAQWGRTDVIDALKHHEIGYHSYAHSMHPTINEYTDIENFSDAIDELIKQESLGLKYVREATGTAEIYAVSPPGNLKSYVAMYGYDVMGIPIYADSFCDDELSTGCYYCNIYHMSYAGGLEDFLLDADEAKIKELVDSIAGRKRAVLYTHPNKVIKSEFWDILNYHKGNLVPYGQWIEAPDRPAADIQKILDNMRLLVRLIKNDGRFRLITFKDIADEIAAEPERTITAADVPAIAAALKTELFPLREPCSLSLSDMMLAMRDFLTGKQEHTCSKVYGFLDRPIGVDTPVTVTLDDMIASCHQIKDGEFLPSRIRVGKAELGPADWLIAAAELLSEKTEKTTVFPKEQLPCLDIFPELRDCRFKGRWIAAPTLEDKYLSDRLRWQSWTMRFTK